MKLNAHVAGTPSYKVKVNSVCSTCSPKTTFPAIKKVSEQQHFPFMAIECFESCTACTKYKQTSKYCWLTGNIKVSKAAHCPTCFKEALLVSSCEMVHNHCGPGFNLPQCCMLQNQMYM